jgi:hypothetical protein
MSMVGQIEKDAYEGMYPKENAYKPPQTSNLRQELMRLEEIAQSMGIAVYRNNDIESNNAWGLSSRTLKIIKLPSFDDVSVDGQWEILAHELGHFFHPPEMSVAAREAYCEFIVAEMAQLLEHPYPYAGAYLIQYKEGIAAAKLYSREIKEAASILLGRKKIPHYMLVKDDSAQ